MPGLGCCRLGWVRLAAQFAQPGCRRDAVAKGSGQDFMSTNLPTYLRGVPRCKGGLEMAGGTPEWLQVGVAGFRRAVRAGGRDERRSVQARRQVPVPSFTSRRLPEGLITRHVCYCVVKAERGVGGGGSGSGFWWLLLSRA